MTTSTSLPNNWILDACCGLNLAATGAVRSILQTPFGAESYQWFLPTKVREEAAFLRRGGAGEGADSRVPCDWETHFATGVLERADLETEEELELFVALSQELDAGEAVCLAIASRRGWGVVTDDIKAQKWAGDVPCLATPDVLKNWSDHHQIAPLQLSQTLNQIRERARYGPPRRHPLRTWWQQNLKSIETS